MFSRQSEYPESRSGLSTSKSQTGYVPVSHRQDKYEKGNKAFEKESDYSSNYKSHAVKSRSKEGRRKETIPVDCATGLLGSGRALVSKESVYGADFKGHGRAGQNNNERLTAPMFGDLKGAESKQKIFGSRRNYTFLESQYKSSFTSEGVYRHSERQPRGTTN